MIRSLFFLAVTAPCLVVSLCPFSGKNQEMGYEMKNGWPQAQPGYADALNKVDFDCVRNDLKALFKVSQEKWPADYGNYGPLFVRLAWHNAGSYRTTDGRGGADGGRQRFEPERSWDDNTNLDKARSLLWPIKEKHGLGLSWGDLIILAGDTAIESMGGPVLGFCAGRIDDPDGYWSASLGPSAEQMELAPCEVNGKCERPLGSSTIGLIYLNPEGPMSQPIPKLSAVEVRDTFGRMAMNDSETVALIGGGHAFGKTHGACPAGPGSSPKEDPANPWPGKCGSGKGRDAFTSGFEGPWTTRPTKWDNEYFHNLQSNDWEKYIGPGGKWMWRVANGTHPTAPSPDGNGTQDIMMMTSDISLISDPTGEYQKLVALFAFDQSKFDNSFAHAWYKLTTRDMGPRSRCVGNNVPPVQDWQNPLPPVPTRLPSFWLVRKRIQAMMRQSSTQTTVQLVRLAYRCAATFRVTDYLGGCNGASIRQSPQKDWSVNAGLVAVQEKLQAIWGEFSNLSWADLIVLAGSIAVEHLAGVRVDFCGGRTDASDGTAADYYLKPRVTGHFSDTLLELRDSIAVMGLTNSEYVALTARPVDLDYWKRSGFGNNPFNAENISNSFFVALSSDQFEEHVIPTSGERVYQMSDVNSGRNFTILKSNMLIRLDPALASIAQDFAADRQVFLSTFVAAWTKLMNADMFDGPTGNLCNRRAVAQDEVVLPSSHPNVFRR